MREHNMNMEGVVKELRTNAVFLEEIVKNIMVNTTELFRDPEVWKHLRDDVLPRFKNKDIINIWHPGCSTGQEVYTLMILLDDSGLFDKSNIFASDLNSDALHVAREGRFKYGFNKNYLDNFDKSMNFSSGNNFRIRNIAWTKYFSIDETRDIIQMKEFLLKKPVYKKMDLVKDPNLFFVNFDLIICRNVIIYFNDQLQNRVFDLFYNNMIHKGCLLLGLHESIMGPNADRFIKNNHFYFKA